MTAASLIRMVITTPIQNADDHNLATKTSAFLEWLQNSVGLDLSVFHGLGGGFAAGERGLQAVVERFGNPLVFMG